MPRATAVIAEQRSPDAASTSIKAQIHDLARQHGVHYERTGLDDWAEAITRLAGDDVRLDETEALLVALTKVGLVSDADSTILHAMYLNERTERRA